MSYCVFPDMAIPLRNVHSWFSARAQGSSLICSASFHLEIWDSSSLCFASVNIWKLRKGVIPTQESRLVKWEVDSSNTGIKGLSISGAHVPHNTTNPKTNKQHISSSTLCCLQKMSVINKLNHFFIAQQKQRRFCYRLIFFLIIFCASFFFGPSGIELDCVGCFVF